MHSEPGDYIGQGQDWNIVYTPENVNFLHASGGQTVAGGASYIRFSMMQNPVSTNYATLDFSTTQLGIPMQPGTYLDARRAAFAPPGHPGLDVTFQHRGSNTLTGEFTVHEAVFEPDPSMQGNYKVIRFKASFKQHSEGNPPALHGTFTYSAVPEPATLLVLAAGGTLLLRRLRRVR